MLRYISAILIILGMTEVSANALDTPKQGVSELSGSEFNYSIIDLGSNKRRIEVIHNREKYDGPLAEMSFRDRHLQVFGMVARLIKGSCQNGVSALGSIAVSRDPEQDEDPDAEHPQIFTWEYSCK
ncbi:hypothetical protein X769_16855 [Mesorhizobium sp. LSJC268A00]|uniref:hypothetical protein n=1 Tax=unclassified Mesorhizobium TaxID=325217 RepID=UPI0003CEB3E9|nr:MULTISPECIES: hypothetical protein [unclassified Mesorhizobium]ESX03936.1 hypothetical protein X769_16855 [Mesorhizobium sp. LSJC268A00]ESZ10580.1 hypothetical protein X735_28100 [Mesorhizobium sp. L2C085B000]ESZ36601.1 hypothetical protein X731_30225 [Mesorhizobium sp. L2C054A000]